MTDLKKNSVIRLDLSTMETLKSSFNLNMPAGLIVNSNSITICDRNSHRLVNFNLQLEYKNVIYSSQQFLYPNCIISCGNYLLVAFQHTRGEQGAEEGVLVGLTRLQL